MEVIIWFQRFFRILCAKVDLCRLANVDEKLDLLDFKTNRIYI
jgi:hypothetical protein